MQHHNSKLASETNIVWIDQIASCGGILSRWCTRRPGTARRRPPSTAREEPLQNRQSRSHFVVESNAVRVIERRIALISDHLGDDVLRDVDPPERPAGLLLPQRQELVSLCDIVLAGGLRTPCRRSPGSWLVNRFARSPAATMCLQSTAGLPLAAGCTAPRARGPLLRPGTRLDGARARGDLQGGDVALATGIHLYLRGWAGTDGER